MLLRPAAFRLSIALCTSSNSSLLNFCDGYDDPESPSSGVIVDADWRPELQERTANQNPASPHPCRLDPWLHVTRGLHMACTCGVG